MATDILLVQRLKNGIIMSKSDANNLNNICAKIYNQNKDCIDTSKTIPDWHEYFMSIAKVVSMRSKDAQTQCGSVIINDNKQIVATGYNSFPAGLPDDILPNLRPKKYPIMIHSEMSALNYCTVDLHKEINATIYITMQPCLQCLKHIMAKGIKTIYALNTPPSVETSKDNDLWSLLVNYSNIKYHSVDMDFSYLKKLPLTL